MVTAPLGAEVVGRYEEVAAIDRFLSGETARALVLEGEPGIGKTTVWLAGIERARERGHRVLRARPAATETSLSLAGLVDLLGDIEPEARRQLPETQRRALAVALGEDEAGSSALEAGMPAVATLGVLRVLGAERPVLLAIDDLQWLDETSGTIIVYVLRRLGEANLRLMASCRGSPGAPLPFGLEQAIDERALVRLPLMPLSEGAIRRLLHLRLGLSLSRAQLAALQGAVRGNPFYALELGRAGIDVDEFGSIRLPRTLHDLILARLETLPLPTRTALIFVAALSDPRLEVLARAGVREELEPALNAGVLEPEDGRVRFVHPLVACAAWSAAGEERRQEVHRALADAVEDPEQRARHLAAATASPDAEVAELLEEAAASARRRGAPAAAADLLDLARPLVPAGELDHWARLAANAASAHAAASHWDSVQELVEEAQARLPAGRERAAILLTAAEMQPGLEDLLQQAVAEAGETAVGVQAWIGLAEQAGFAGRWGEAVERAREATTLARRLGDRALLGVALTWLGGLKHLDTQLDGWEEISEALAIEQELGSLPTSVFQTSRTWQGAALLFSDDPDRARALFEERLRTASERGDDMSAFQSMQLLVLAELRAGDWAGARATGRIALELVESIGYEFGRPVLLGSLAALEAYEGDLERARALGTEAVSTLTAFGDRYWSTFALASLVFTELCAGNAAAALAHADAISSRFPERECWWSHHQGDEIEALVLAGEHERALDRAATLRRVGNEIDLPRFLAWADRGEGLVRAAGGDLTAAREALESALAEHERYSLAFERARTLLAYGNVLRRQKRRGAARTVLGEALAEFERLGARRLAAAAQAELKHVSGRSPAGEHELTPAEERIARLVAAGHSNKEVAAQLCVAVSTVEKALTRVYGKLGLSSRLQLARAIAERLPEG